MANDRQTNYFVHTLLRARGWQHRPEFDQVCDWWRDGGRGVCALVGMGGAGKTAIADRFLNELLHENTSTTRERVSPPLPPPNSIFVYSFYDDKPENFFRHLQIWLEGTSAPDKQKSPTQLMFDIQQHQGLIILDALERIQESGARGGFGCLTSPSLRDPLNHIASGSARELSGLVTSRFPLTDLRDSQPRFFHTILVDQIDVEAGIALLRERGVRGTDVQLAPIVEHCGRHALTVDLAGGYIKEYGHGEPSTPLNLGTAEELQAEAEDEPDDEKRAVLIQGIRFARIAQRYREAMLISNEAALALLERICLFRLGVDCETLAAIFTGPTAEKVSGKALASLDAEQLQNKLDWLVRMRVVEKALSLPLETENSKPKTLYNIHPAVRAGFLTGIGREDASFSHEAVRKGLEVSLGDASGTHPTDAPTLELLEEVIHHALGSGRVDEAWQIYHDRVGGYEHLGWKLGNYERGVRICDGLVAAFEFPPTGYLRNDRSLMRRFCPLLMVGSFVSLYTIDSFVWRPFDYGYGDQHALLCYVGLIAYWILFWSVVRKDGIEAFTREISIEIRCELSLHKALYLKDSGCLVDAISAYQQAFLYHQTAERDRTSYFQGIHAGLAETMLLAGKLRGAQELRQMMANGFSVTSLIDSSSWEQLLGFFHLLRGDITGALEAFKQSTRYRHHAISWEYRRPIAAMFGSRYASSNLFLRSQVEETCDGKESPRINAFLQLSTAQQRLSERDVVEARKLVSAAKHWARQCDVLEALCWSALVNATIELVVLGDLSGARDPNADADRLSIADASIATGLKIARDCGYGLYHIDLLLERARLHLLRGDASAALDDIEVALDTGIPANEETGQVELLAANHEECGYAWAIPAGLQLRAEALLLQAAQSVGSTRLHRGLAQSTLTKWHLKLLQLAETKSIRGRLRELCSEEAVESPWLPCLVGPGSPGEMQLLEMLRRLELLRYVRKDEEPDPNDWSDWIICWRLTADGSRLVQRADGRGVDSAVRELIAQARGYLIESLERWHDLRDPEPTEDNNFKHPETGKEYNYRAAETWQILQDLDRGVLAKYPLKNIIDTESNATLVQTHELSPASNRFHVALSFPGEHRAFVLQVADALAAKLNNDRVFYDEWYEAELLGSGGDLKLQSMYEQADLVVPFFSEYYDKPWCSMEWETIRGILLTRRKDDAVIPVHLDDTDIPGWPAVNFGIRLKGRSPQQIAEVILQALAKRIANVAKDDSASTRSADDRLSSDLTGLAKREPVVWLASLVLECCLRTPVELAEPYDFDELKTCIQEAEELVAAGESQAGDPWAKKNSLQAVTLVAVGLAHTIRRSPQALIRSAGFSTGFANAERWDAGVMRQTGAEMVRPMAVC